MFAPLLLAEPDSASQDVRVGPWGGGGHGKIFHGMQIYVDADACPVKAEIVRVAERHGLTVHMVSNSWMRLDASPLIKRVVVNDGPDVADDWIAERICASDIAVTADILLAARCLKAGAQCIGPTGKPFSDANIGMALAMREMQRQLRVTGESRGFNAAFTPRDRSQFLQALEHAIQVGKRRP
jgi:uncharacterized protein YaiI (UPF0178 family)